MLEGKCAKCGAHYYGWALKIPRNQMCGKCGTALEITEDGHRISAGYSPFSADEYIIKHPPNANPVDEKKKDGAQKSDTA